MAPVACRESYRDGLVGTGITSVISYWPVSQKSHWHDANICLGENPAENFNRFDLCYSFNLLCDAEYGGRKGLHIADQKLYEKLCSYRQALWEPADPLRTGSSEPDRHHVLALGG